MPPQIMVVDDSEEDLELIRDVFKEVAPDLEITTASGGREALARASLPDETPMVMLLDLRMPDIGGLEVLKRLKKDSRLRRIVVCVFSSGNLPADVSESYDLGANSYFKKPTGLAELRNFAQCFVALWFRYALHCSA